MTFQLYRLTRPSYLVFAGAEGIGLLLEIPPISLSILLSSKDLYYREGLG